MEKLETIDHPFDAASQLAWPKGCMHPYGGINDNLA